MIDTSVIIMLNAYKHHPNIDNGRGFPWWLVVDE
jgi:hypothetical protein